MRVRFEERRERQLAGGNPRNSPRESYTFPASDTTKLRAGAGGTQVNLGRSLGSRQRRRGFRWQLRNLALVHRLATAGSIASGDENFPSQNILQVLNITTLLPQFYTD